MRINFSKIIIVIEFVLLFFLGISQILSNSYLNIVFVTLIFIMYVISNLENEIKQIFILLPFFNMLNFNLGSISLFYIFLVVFIIKYLLYKRFKIDYKKIAFFLLLILVRIPGEDYSLLFRWILLISILFLTYDEKFFITQIREIVTLISISFLISSSIGYYMQDNGLSIYTSGHVYNAGYTTTRFAGLIGDSVFYSQFAVLLQSSCLVVNYYSKKNNYIRYIIVGLLELFLVFTYSKLGILLSLFVLFIFLLFIIFKDIKSKKTIIKSIIILIISFLAVILSIRYVFVNSNSQLIKNYYIRFTSSDLFTGRSKISEHYIYLLSHSWRTIFVSMKDSVYSTPFNIGVYKLMNRTHNIYIETICAYGMIVSLLIFVWILLLLFRKFKQKNNIICSLPMIIILISGITLHGHFEFHYYFLVAIALGFLDKDVQLYLVDKEHEVNNER